MKNNDKNILTVSRCTKSCKGCKKSTDNCNRNKVVKKLALDDSLEDENQVLERL